MSNLFEHSELPDNLQALSIKQFPEYREMFTTYISEAWPPVKDTAIRQMEESLTTAAALPLTFMLIRDGRIIGFYQLVEQEQLMRKDLSPWIAPLFIDSGARGSQLGSLLLLHARHEAGKLGYPKIYLTTDHIQFYEKYGFREIGLSNFVWGRPSKIYEHDTLHRSGLELP